MDFSNWLLLNENIEQNFDKWLETIADYAKGDEKTLLFNIIGYWEPSEIKVAFNNRLKRWKEIIISVLKEKRLETLNWLSFSIGYLAAKTFAKEDLELAIDVTRRRIASGELPKTEIGKNGWMITGLNAKNEVEKYLLDQQELSNRQKNKLKKQGEVLEEDEDLIKVIVKEDNLVLFMLPSLNLHPEHASDLNKRKIESRKRLLCKYGLGTKWCTANPSGTYDQYYMNNDIFILYENNKPKYQFTGCQSFGRAGSSDKQFMDTDDNRVSELTLKEIELLEKYIKEDVSCYKFKIIFSDLKSYLNSRHKENASAESLMNLIKDENFKKLTTKQIKEIINDLDISGFPASKTLYFIDILPAEYFNLLNSNKIIHIIKNCQWQDSAYGILEKKLSKNRFEEILDSRHNDVYDDPKDVAYDAQKQKSRKTTIRELLNSSVSIEKSLNILDLIIKKTNVGPAEAYTIFDTIIQIITKAYYESLISTPTVYGTLNKFAQIFGKENINKIDLDRLQQRLPSIKLIPDGNKYKISIDKYEDLDSFPANPTLGFKSIAVKFLAKYNEKISKIISI